MKRIALISVTSLISIIIGIVIGASTLAYYIYEDKGASEVLQLHNNIGMHVGILNEIHRGDLKKAKELHEVFLDTEVIGLTPYISPEHPNYKEAQEAAWVAANYRKHNKYTGSGDKVNKHVQSILEHGLLIDVPCPSPNKALNNDAQKARAC